MLTGQYKVRQRPVRVDGPSPKGVSYRGPYLVQYLIKDGQYKPIRECNRGERGEMNPLRRNRESRVKFVVKDTLRRGFVDSGPPTNTIDETRYRETQEDSIVDTLK